MIYSLHPSCPFPALHSGNPWQRPHSHQATEWQTARTIWKRINHSVIERSNHSWKVCFFSIVMLHLICLERQMSLGLLHPNNFETKAYIYLNIFKEPLYLRGINENRSCYTQKGILKRPRRFQSGFGRGCNPCGHWYQVSVCGQIRLRGSDRGQQRTGQAGTDESGAEVHLLAE